MTLSEDHPAVEAISTIEREFYSFLTALEDARKGFHNSEQWYDFGPAGDNETTYQDRLDVAERRVRAAINAALPHIRNALLDELAEEAN